jgi:hypothetical protein
MARRAMVRNRRDGNTIDLVLVAGRVAWRLTPREDHGNLLCDPFCHRVAAEKLSTDQPDDDQSTRPPSKPATTFSQKGLAFVPEQNGTATLPGTSDSYEREALEMLRERIFAG